jgi:toxin ParE1/3/4
VKRYVVSREACADLDRMWDYIAERSSVETGTEFIWRFYKTFKSIGSSPAAGVAIPHLAEHGPAPPCARKFPMGNYLIYYRPKRGKVEILRVLHGKGVQTRALRQKP